VTQSPAQHCQGVPTTRNESDRSPARSPAPRGAAAGEGTVVPGVTRRAQPPPRGAAAPQARQARDPSPAPRTLVRCSLPPEPRVQMIRCLEKRKHCRSPSFLSEREPSRPRVIFPFSDIGTWIRDPAGHRPVPGTGGSGGSAAGLGAREQGIAACPERGSGERVPRRRGCDRGRPGAIGCRGAQRLSRGPATAPAARGCSSGTARARGVRARPATPATAELRNG